MKKSFKCLLAAIMSLAILLSGAMGTGIQNASAAEAIKLTEGSEFEVKPGETSQIKVSVMATNLYIYNPKISISGDKDSPFSFSKPKMYVNDAEVTSIGTGKATDMLFDVTVKDTAKIGTYPVTITFEYNDVITLAPLTDSITIKLKITSEKTPAQLTVSNVFLSSNSIGSTTDFVFTVKNEGEVLAKNAYLVMDFGEGIEEKYTVKNIKLGDMKQGDVRDLKLPINILPTAEAGRKKITANFTYKSSDGTEFTSKYEVSITITDAVQESKVPRLIITDINYGKNLQPGDEFDLSIKLENVGGAGAQNVTAAIDSSSISGTGIIKNYYMESLDVDDIGKNDKASVEMPLKVAKGSTGGLLPVKLVVTYMDSEDTTYTLTDTVYIDVETVEDKETEEKKPNLVISNVSQKPSKPVAGNEVEISFDLENKGNADAKELMVSVEGLSDDTFIPVDPDPYQYFDMLKSGEKIRITIPLITSNSIPEGLNNIKVKIAYDGNRSLEANIPVKNVQNDAAGISKPVLLISNYSADVEELKAGTVFNLTFDIYNTNASTAAKNIKVTVKKPTDPNVDVFTLTQGNNSFFINKLNPEESVSKTIQMKVKASASTQTYPVILQIEYEYEGLKPDPQTGNIKGIEMSAELNLQVIENARPVVDNAYIYSWDGPVTVGNAATLHFDFYNMGRSQLNNVTVIVEGDFTKADGSMYFIGTTPAGGTSYGDFDVIPNVAGTAKCIIRVTFEDSNGDVKEYVHEFTTEVMEAGGMLYPDTGYIPDGGEVFNPGGVMPKKNIVPLWAFILIQCAIVILFVPITRKVIISVYKARLIKKEQGKY